MRLATVKLRSRYNDQETGQKCPPEKVNFLSLLPRMRLTVTLISERVNDHTLNAMSAEQNS